MKDNERKISSKILAFFCFLAIILAVIGIIASFVRIYPTVETTTETFVGILATFIGICVTFAVGFQIYSILDIRENVKDIKRIEKELVVTKEELEVATKNLDATKNELENLKYSIRAENQVSIGNYVIAQKEYLVAICHYLRGFYYSLESDNLRSSKLSLHNCEVTLSKWDSDPPEYPFDCSYSIEGDHPKDAITRTINEIIENNYTSEVYKQLEPQFRKIENAIKKKIEDYETKE